MRTISRALLVAGVFAASACTEDAPVGTVTDLTRTLPAEAVQALVQSSEGPSAGTIRLRIRILTKDVPLASYQGVVSFDAGSFELVSVETPRAEEGGMYLVNPGEIANGQIRFAAFTTEKFLDDEAFSLIVKPLRPIGQMQLRATLDVAGETSGTALAGAQLRGSTGVHDQTGRLIQ